LGSHVFNVAVKSTVLALFTMPLSMPMKAYKDLGNARLKKSFTASCIVFVPFLGVKFLVKALTYPEGIAG
jgi:hypothetical protein